MNSHDIHDSQDERASENYIKTQLSLALREILHTSYLFQNPRFIRPTSYLFVNLNKCEGVDRSGNLSKKNPNAEANRHPSTKSIRPIVAGLLTVIVYRMRKSKVKNKWIKL
jgi:hypothetical protein